MASSNGRHLVGLHLAARLGRNVVALPLHTVGGVAGLDQVRPTLQPPERLRGRLELYGRTMPLVDLRVAFGLDASFTGTTRFVVVWRGFPGCREDPLALVFDRVDDVVALNEGVVELPPVDGLALKRDYLAGVIRDRGVVHLLLDVGRLAEKRR